MNVGGSPGLGQVRDTLAKVGPMLVGVAVSCILEVVVW